MNKQSKIRNGKSTTSQFIIGTKDGKWQCQSHALPGPNGGGLGATFTFYLLSCSSKNLNNHLYHPGAQMIAAFRGIEILEALPKAAPVDVVMFLDNVRIIDPEQIANILNQLTVIEIRLENLATHYATNKTRLQNIIDQKTWFDAISLKLVSGNHQAIALDKMLKIKEILGVFVT